MKTSLYFDPSVENETIAEMKAAEADFARKFPHRAPGVFSYKGEHWHETPNGYRLSVSHSIRELPLVAKGVPIHRIEIEDSVEDLKGDIQLVEGIYLVYSTRAEVDSYVSSSQNSAPFTIYTIKVEGTDLAEVNRVYTEIRQGKATPTEAWQRFA